MQTGDTLNLIEQLQDMLDGFRGFRLNTTRNRRQRNSRPRYQPPESSASSDDGLVKTRKSHTPLENAIHVSRSAFSLNGSSLLLHR